MNGKQTTINSNFSLKNLVDKLQIPLNKIAIEYNREIVNKKKLEKILLSKNDKVEIVHFIGGG